MLYIVIAALMGAFVAGQFVSANVLSCLMDERHDEEHGHLETNRQPRQPTSF